MHNVVSAGPILGGSVWAEFISELLEEGRMEVRLHHPVPSGYSG